MKLRCTFLRERSQNQKPVYCVVTSIVYSGKGKTNNRKHRSQIARVWAGERGQLHQVSMRELGHNETGLCHNCGSGHTIQCFCQNPYNKESKVYYEFSKNQSRYAGNNNNNKNMNRKKTNLTALQNNMVTIMKGSTKKTDQSNSRKLY